MSAQLLLETRTLSNPVFHNGSSFSSKPNNSFQVMCASVTSELKRTIMVFPVSIQNRTYNHASFSKATVKPIVMSSVERAFTYDLADMVKALESPMIELPDDITDIDAFDAWLEQF